MNKFQALFFSFTAAVLIKKATPLKEPLLIRTGFAPIAVLQSDDSLKLAIPHAFQPNTDYVGYDYDSEKDPQVKFMIACPANRFGKQSEMEDEWRKTGATSDESQLFFLLEYEGPSQCYRPYVPSIRKVDVDDEVKYCSQPQAEFYEVGYPVTNDEGMPVQFLSMYKICYSKAEGKSATKYSIHRIESPSVLFLNKIRELPDPSPLIICHKSFLDSSLNTKEYFEDEKSCAYQFVGTEDMPTRAWEHTTEFLFNYTPITRNDDIFKGMIRTDWYIRLYSHKHNKPLTLYSGTHQEAIKHTIPCTPIPCGSTTIDLFWRIITNDEGHAIILVTKHTLEKCDQNRTIYAKKNRQVKTYTKGGCIYKCSLDTNDPLFEMMDLPPLEISEDLDFTFETNETNATSSDKQSSSDTKSSNTIDIIDFLNNTSFKDAIKKR